MARSRPTQRFWTEATLRVVVPGARYTDAAIPNLPADELDALYEEAFLNKDFALEFLKARKFTFKGMDDPKDPELSWYVKKEGDEPPYELMVQDVEIVVDQAPPSSTRVSGVEAVRLAEYREKREKLVADKIQTAVNDFKEKADSCEPVSYTHLTLPTICSV